MRGYASLVSVCLVATLLHSGPAHAQKVPGSTIPLAPDPVPRTIVTPRAPASAPPAYTRPALPSAAAPQPPAAPVVAEHDAEARQLANQLPLDPATANLEGRMPTDVRGTTARLGLRTPTGTRTDLRTQPATREDIINALRH